MKTRILYFLVILFTSIMLGCEKEETFQIKGDYKGTYLIGINGASAYQDFYFRGMTQSGKFLDGLFEIVDDDGNILGKGNLFGTNTIPNVKITATASVFSIPVRYEFKGLVNIDGDSMSGINYDLKITNMIEGTYVIAASWTAVKIK